MVHILWYISSPSLKCRINGLLLSRSYVKPGKQQVPSELQSICILLLQITEMALYFEFCVSQVAEDQAVVDNVKNMFFDFQELVGRFDLISENMHLPVYSASLMMCPLVDNIMSDLTMNRIKSEKSNEISSIKKPCHMCSIDGLLDRTIQHMMFFISVTDQADKLRQVIHQEATQRKNGKSVDRNDSQHNGASWAYDLGPC
ncbi:hypothetical protein POM88_018351 [Heracleum sosnowskyi]|uniref:BHLH domain-containing protein n=1 Tax=Heracleum sosnowskyi TaxID=360622 RepID=A0AAD8IS61_9APIA|nr:hypothetical protein POM88_018351 [Heracleum sosnowskyi]